MKYLLMITAHRAAPPTRTEEDRTAGYAAHDRLIALTRESGELVGFVALADPSNSRTVRVRAGVPAVTDGPYLEATEFLAGYYLLDCETPARAEELAALIPDARFAGVEVRPVMESGGLEM